MNRQSLTVQNLSKQYRAGKTIFSDINMEFKPGEATGFIGPNGSGKTTFLRLLSVTSFPTKGTVTCGEIDIHKHPHKYLKQTGLVHDEESLPLHLSAVELLEWILRTRKLWNGESGKKIGNYLDTFELFEERDQPIGTYSTGMKKKTQITAALISDPKILILDEPLRGLDVKTRETALNYLRTKKSDGAIILMASHTMTDKESFFDHILNFPL